MVYLDNAATSLKKPKGVFKNIKHAMLYAGGYGRSGHKAAIYAGELVYECRELVQKLFNVESPEQVVFTMNTTHALNQAIHTLAPKAKKVALTGYEHNSVIRPLVQRNIKYDVIDSGLFDIDGMINGVKCAINNGCDLFIINHISNVFGQIAPIYEIDKLLYSANASMILDAAQSAGNKNIDLSKLKSVKALCAAGHKGLMGPQGTGLLVVCTNELFDPLMQGGTGSFSNEPFQPDIMPDRLESGTPNVCGIAGLSCGIRTILLNGAENIGQYESMLANIAATSLEKFDNIQVFKSLEQKNQSGVLSFRCEGIHCEQIAEFLAQNNVCVRAGLHCSALAHKTAKTFETGTIRVSFGFYNTKRDVNELVWQIKRFLIKNEKYKK